MITLYLSVFDLFQLVPMPEQSAAAQAATFFGDGSPPVQLVPLGLVVTEFHALIAYNNRIRGICLLNEQVKITGRSRN